jgi:transposase InsO family protein
VEVRFTVFHYLRMLRVSHLIVFLLDLFIFRGIPEHIQSDNGPEFTAKAVREWLNRLGVKTLFIERGSPWESGYMNPLTGNSEMSY